MITGHYPAKEGGRCVLGRGAAHTELCPSNGTEMRVIQNLNVSRGDQNKGKGGKGAWDGADSGRGQVPEGLKALISMYEVH